MAAIRVIRVDEAIWASAPALRRQDWRVSITDLLRDARLGADGEHLLLVSADTRALTCATFDEAGAPRATYAAHEADLRSFVEEYLSVIRRLGVEEARTSPRMIALDMAKKVVHDGAARTLAHCMPGLAHDHDTYRRLFSLLFSLVVDVTRLAAPDAHRRHGG